jgi:D-sedoheptulose 7-phosphate isomerase
MHHMAELFHKSEDFSDYSIGYFERLAEFFSKIDLEPLGRIAAALDKARTNGSAIYFIANGGSSAIASHWVNDLLVGAQLGDKPGFRAYCPTDNSASVTAIGNDSCFENVFAAQLRVQLQPGDVVYAMSVSGNSENIVRGLQAAIDKGATTIGVSGMAGGRMLALCDIGLHIPSTADEYGPVEDMFSIVEHLIAGYLTMKGGKMMHH